MLLSTKSWATVAALSLSLSAQDADSRWRFSGFGTLGLAASSTKEAEFGRDLSQPHGATTSIDPAVDSRLGLQANLRLTDELGFVGQVISKYRYDHTFTPELSWAFLSYAPTSGIQARVGRLGWDVLQLADTRNVGFSYLWVRPPVEFYGTLLVSHLDGADLAWTAPLGTSHTLRCKIAGGRATEKVPLEASGAHLDLGGSMALSALAEYQGEALSFRLSFAQFRFGPTEFPRPVAGLQEGLRYFGNLLGDPGLVNQAASLTLKDRTARYYSAGLGWQKGPWRLESAGARVQSEGLLPPDFKSGYVSVGYRTGRLVPFLLASRGVSSHPDAYVGALPALGPEAAALAAGVQAYVQSIRMDQTTFGLGLRWDFHPKAALKAQLDRVNAEPGGRLLWILDQPGWNGKATVASLALDFVF